jgi:hypothetical protein
LRVPCGAVRWTRDQLLQCDYRSDCVLPAIGLSSAQSRTPATRCPSTARRAAPARFIHRTIVRPVHGLRGRCSAVRHWCTSALAKLSTIGK